MDNAEIVVDVLIQELRKAAPSVSDAAWELIKQEALINGGLDALTGTSAMIVQDAVLKHGSPGEKGYAQMHPKGGGGGSSSRIPRGGGAVTNDQAEVNRRRAEDEASKKQIREAKGKGLQPADGSGERWKKGMFGPGNDSLSEPSDHGQIMASARLMGGTPRVKTENGATAAIKGWKHRDDVASGDVIALPGRSYNKSRAFEITGVKGEGIDRRWSATPIGKKGKATGVPVELSMADLGAGDGAITIVRPRQVS